MKGNTDRFHLRLRRGDSNQIQIGDSEAATQSCSQEKVSENMQQIYRRTLMQLYGNHTSAWVFSCKFAAYFQNAFPKEQLWWTVSGNSLIKRIPCEKLLGVKFDHKSLKLL